MPPAAKASIAFFLSSLVTKGISYIVTPIYTRLLTEAQYGQVSVFMTWLEIFGIIAMFCLSYGVFNNGMVDHPEKRSEFSFSMLILSNIITLCFSGILLCLYPLIKTVIEIEFPFVVLMCVLFFFHPAYSFWVARQRYELKYKKTICFSIASAILSPTVAVLCILFSGRDEVYSRIFGAQAVLLLIYIIFYVYLWVQNKGKINTSYWKEAFLFNLPLIPHYLSIYLLSSSDKIMISHLVGKEAVAFYSLAHSIAAVILVVWSAINSSLIPYTYEKCKVGDYKSIGKITSPILLCFAVVCGIMILVAPELMTIMAPASYRESIMVIPPIVGGVFFQVHYFIYANVVYYHKKPKYVMIASITATVLNLALNYFFIKEFGYVAAGYTTLVSYLVQATIDYFVMRKVVKQKVYDMKFIGALSFIVLLIAVFSSLLYDYIIVRYVILAVILALCIVFHKKIIAVIKGVRKRENKQNEEKQESQKGEENAG